MSQLQLSQLDLTPQHVPHLPAVLRNRLLDFLARWQAYEDLLACLAQLDVARYVSFQDAQAQALLGLERAEEAVAVMQARVAQRESVPAFMLLGRTYLAVQRYDEALAALRSLPDEYGPAWSLRGEIHREIGRLDEAERALLRHRQLASSSRTPLFGLARLYHQRGDGVTAAAYAVQAFTVGEEEHPLNVYEVRAARDLFALLKDANRLDEANAMLAQRLETELNSLLADLAGDGRIEAPPAQKGITRPQPTPEQESPPLSDLTQIAVTAQEETELAEAVQRFFHFPALRPGQAQVMACTRRGEDVLAILPTGAGKSLCYQLPALLDGGLTLVISPLIALMKDQVDGLPPALRSQSIAINSSMEGDTMAQAMADVAAGRYRLVYAAPERLRQLPFLHAVASAGLSRLVIDEAHCVSAWGHDFRPDYLYIAEAHRQLGAPPILALTATAPTQVRRDIERQLFGVEEASTRHLQVVALDSFRPNLRLATLNVSDKDGKYQQLVDLCQQLPGSGIVYARTRRDCEELAALLVSQGVDTVHYHAGIADRAGVQDRFMRGEVRVIVATIAFGMGIDKGDIRFIIHFGLPDSLEAYYQEAGRAGRDGEPAHCVLVYSSSDKGRLTRNTNQDALTIDFLRDLYGGVKRQRRVGTYVLTPLDDLVRQLGVDDTRVRVGLSFLEQADLLRRHLDAPRTLSLRLLTTGQDPAVDHFAAEARLRVHQLVDRSYAELCAQTEIPPSTLEASLLAWQAAGRIRADVAGRDLLLELLPPPADGTERITALLDRHAAIQGQRISEIVGYARSRRCLHGHLSNYLGGARRERCNVCNRCVGDALLPEAESTLPGEGEQLRMILQVLSAQNWGRRTLIYLLRGDVKAGGRAQQSRSFGYMNFRSETALDAMLDSLLRADCLEELTLSHGGMALALTQKGQTALKEPEILQELTAPPPSFPQPTATPLNASSVPLETADAQARLERLRAWRAHQATEQQVPLYLIASNDLLHNLALLAPSTPEELAGVKGIGPTKLEQYGAAILAVVQGESPA
jgi:ATP-dependent DNA helicase RecQ